MGSFIDIIRSISILLEYIDRKVTQNQSDLTKTMADAITWSAYAKITTYRHSVYIFHKLIFESLQIFGTHFQDIQTTQEALTALVKIFRI